MLDGLVIVWGFELDTVDGKHMLIACDSAPVISSHMIGRARALAKKLRMSSLSNR